MKKLLLASLLSLGSLYAQCQFNNVQAPFTGAANGSSYRNYNINNASTWCNTFAVQYWSTGFSALSISLQTANDNSGAAGSFSDVSSGIIVGTVPSTSLSGLIIVQTYAPWLRVKVNSVTGTGTISYVVNGSNGIQGIGAVVSATFTPSGTQDVNLKQVGGSSISIGQAAMAASLPVVIANNQSDVGTNIDKYGGTSTTLGQKTMAASMPVVLASDQAAIPVTVSVNDPCATANAKTVVPINSAGASTSLKLFSLVNSKKWYICSINVGPVSAAVNVALVEGTKTTTECDTSTAGMAGGATAATGWQFAINGGLTMGSGTGTIAVTATAAHDVCLLFSTGVQVSGVITGVNQ